MGNLALSDNVSLDGVVFPVVLGAGERLSRETSDKKRMRLVDTQTVEGDVVFLAYEVIRKA